MEMKICAKCGKKLPYTDEYFQGFIDKRNNRRRLRSDCKKCSKKYAKEWRRKNKEKGMDYQKNWYEKNKEKGVDYQKNWYENNKGKARESNKDWYRKNKEKSIAYHKDWYKENKGKAKENYNNWRNENKEKFNEYNRVYRQKKRSAIKKLPHTFTTNDWELVKNEFDNKCAYCGITEEEHLEVYKESLHQDHFVALSKGGGYTADNIVPACRSCNSSKNNRPFSEWYKEYEHYSKDRERFIKNYLSEVRNA